MSCGNLFRELKTEPAHVKLVYLVAEQLANCRDTVWKGKPIAAGEFITSLGHLADHTSLSIKLVRSALARLQLLGVLKVDTTNRRFTRICLLSQGTVSGTVSGTKKTSKIRVEFAKVGTASSADLGNSCAVGVLALSHSPDVGVSSALQRSKVGETRAPAREAPPALPHPRTPAKTRYEMAVARAPELPTVVIHIDRLFFDLSGCPQFPWVGNPTAETRLADLIVSHGASLVMAAAERFFIRGDRWVEERAWAIDEFCRQFAKLIAQAGSTKRSAEIVIELKNQTLPSTPRELKAKLATIRQRPAEPMDDYDPSEVNFVQDFRRLRAEQAELAHAG